MAREPPPTLAGPRRRAGQSCRGLETEGEGRL